LERGRAVRRPGVKMSKLMKTEFGQGQGKSVVSGHVVRRNRHDEPVDVDAMQDWSELAGSVLCRSCYVQYSKTGTLERIKQGPLAKSAKRCCYDGCKTPTESRQFLRIEGASQAGGQVFSLPHARVAFW